MGKLFWRICGLQEVIDTLIDDCQRGGHRGVDDDEDAHDHDDLAIRGPGTEDRAVEVPGQHGTGREHGRVRRGHDCRRDGAEAEEGDPLRRQILKRSGEKSVQYACFRQYDSSYRIANPRSPVGTMAERAWPPCRRAGVPTPSGSSRWPLRRHRTASPEPPSLPRWRSRRRTGTLRAETPMKYVLTLKLTFLCRISSSRQERLFLTAKCPIGCQFEKNS